MTTRQDNPAISIIIPTCHRNDLLARCLDSLAPGVQTLPPEQYEVVVTDDGSHSTAQQMVQDSYPWVRWVEGPRRGPAANRNNGAVSAKGEWLVFTDDDCLPMRNWLVAYAEARTNGVLVYEGKTICAEGITSPLYQSPINLTGGSLWSCNFMIQASLFRVMGGFDTEFAMPAMEDVDLHDRLSQQEQVVVFVKQAIVDHPPRRINPGSKTGRMYEAKVQYWNKRGQAGQSLTAYLKHLKHQIYWLRQFGLHRDLLPVFLELIAESVFVLPRLSAWEKKYQARYRS